MAEDAKLDEERARSEAKKQAERRRLNDWMLRQLGSGWQSLGDGIFYPQGTAPPRSAVGS